MTAAMAPNLLETLPLPEKAVAVAGLFRTRCGIQRGAQLMLRDLRRRGYRANAVDMSSSLPLSLDEPETGLLRPRDLAHLSTDALLLHVCPPLFAQALDAFPRALRRQTRLIGYWVWELTVLPESWRADAQLCDALWAPSPFVAETLARELPAFRGPIEVVPHQVDLDPTPRLDAAARSALRHGHGLKDTDFVCGLSFSFLSGYARKNPMGAIEAFTRAFPGAEADARLLIRTHHGERYPALYQALQERAAQDPRILLFDAAIRPWPMEAFLNGLDVFLSLHRSEGYGLVIAEAAQAGAAVLATEWGLAPDLAARPGVHGVAYRLAPPDDPQNFYTGIDGALWADPDLDHAAQLLRDLRGARG